MMQVKTNSRCSGYLLTFHTSACNTEGSLICSPLSVLRISRVTPITAHASYAFYRALS